MQKEISKRAFGSTGMEVSCVVLGGEGILRTYGKEKAAELVIREALSQGLNYFDCAQAYAGSESYYGAVWSKQPEIRAGVFQASKSAQRDRRGALEELEQSLFKMGVDHLDLWQIHDVRTFQELDLIAGSGGALEAFIAAKAAGKTRFIGVTGHHHPGVLTKAVKEWPVDAVMLPVNPVEAVLGGFLDSTVPAAKEKEIAVIGMKVLGASHYISPDAGITAEVLIRFALAQPVSVAIVGCSTPQHVQTLAAAGKGEPLHEIEQQSIVDAFRPYAAQLAYYRGVK